MDKSINFSNILPSHLKDTVKTWIQDDMPSFDVGGLVVGNKKMTAKLLMKSPGIFAGKPFVDLVFDVLNCTVEWTDGKKKDSLCVFHF